MTDDATECLYPDDYPWGLEEMFGLLMGAGAVAVALTIWFKKRFWSE